MSSEFNLLLRERKLLKTYVTRGMIVKEIRAAEADLQDAHDSFDVHKFK